MDLSRRTPPFSTGYAVRSVAKGVRADTDCLFGVGRSMARATPGDTSNGISDWIAVPRSVCGDALVQHDDFFYTTSD